MVRVSIRRVIPGQVEVLREWFREVSGPRRSEALETLSAEGCTHEQALLIEGNDGPIVVYVMEVADLDQSIYAASDSRHQIDTDHKEVLSRTLGYAVPCEVLLDLRP